MARAVSASVLGRFREAVEKYDLLPSGARVLVAVSGGADSVCLLDLLRAVASLYRLELVGFHLNHGLRESAKEDEEFVRGLFAGETLVVVRARVRAFALRHRMGIEEAGRALRYRHLERVAAKLGCGRVALGHNANDNLETMLLNLARGAGREGVSGIPARRGVFVRPMIDVEREEIARYLQARGLTWREDESNEDTAFRRNLVRLRVVPALKEVNSALVRNARRAAEILAEEDEYLERLAEEALREAAGGGKAEVRRQKAVVKNQMSEGRCQKSEVEDQMSEGRSQSGVIVDCKRFSLYNICLKRRMVRQLITGLDADETAKAASVFCPGPDVTVALRRSICLVRRGGFTRIIEGDNG